MMDARYIKSVFLPRTLFITNIDATLAAGPAINKTSAVPGLKPLSINATAMGMEPVAHRYIGIAHTSTSNMLNRGLSAKDMKKLSGTNTVISPATIRPMMSHAITWWRKQRLCV